MFNRTYVTHARHTEPLSATSSTLPARYELIPPFAGRSSLKEIEPLSATYVRMVIRIGLQPCTEDHRR